MLHVRIKRMHENLIGIASFSTRSSQLLVSVSFKLCWVSCLLTLHSWRRLWHFIDFSSGIISLTKSSEIENKIRWWARFEHTKKNKLKENTIRWINNDRIDAIKRGVSTSNLPHSVVVNGVLFNVIITLHSHMLLQIAIWYLFIII